MRNHAASPARIAGVIVLIAMLCMSLFPCGALAAGPGQIDTTKEVSLTLTGAPCAGVTYRLYHIGTVSADVQFALTEAYAGYPISLQQEDAEGWLDLASTLKTYIARDGLAADAMGVTDSNGSVAFSDVEQGLYAIIGDSFDYGSYTYTPTPYILCLPNLEKTGDASYTWAYDVSSIPKMSQKEHGGGGGGGDADALTIRVIKVWNQSSNTMSERPESVDIQLLNNGTVYDTKTVSEATNWRCEWNNLGRDINWSVMEADYSVGGHFKVTVSSQSSDSTDTYTVTNTYYEHDGPYTPPSPSPTPDTPDDPNTPDNPDNPGGGGSSDTPDNPDTPADIPDEDVPSGPWDTPDEPGTPDESIPDENVPAGSLPQETPKDLTELNDGNVPAASKPQETLPQTGVLWWPVPVMACAGLVLFGIGWGITGRRPEDD